MPFPIVDLIVTRNIANATDAANQALLIAPYDLKVVSIQARHKVASTSGTMSLVKAASATAISAGTAITSATMSSAGTADTNVTGTLSTTIGTNYVPKGTCLGLIFAGTLTNLINLDVTVVLRQLKKS